ncbi:MAG TPA: hypothetical protein VF452_21230 [Candidatus Binatia bacterium]
MPLAVPEDFILAMDGRLQRSPTFDLGQRTFDLEMKAHAPAVV